MGDAPPHAAKYQRIDPNKERRVSDKIKRLRTDTLARDYTESSSVNIARAEVYKLLLERLQQAQIPVDNNNIASLGFLWPSAHPGIWLKLLSHPLTVTDEELGTILDLEDSNSQTPGPDLGDQIYYVRSFRLRVSDLRQIIAQWNHEGRHSDECTAWARALVWLQNDQQHVYIRYVGTSTVVSAHERFVQDFVRTSGLYGHFCGTLLKDFPDSTCSIFTVAEATTRSFGHGLASNIPFRLHADHTDIREQALIALFDHNVLLNRQVGGLSVAYQPPQKDIMCFEALGTQVVTKLLPEVSRGYAEPTEKVKRLVTNWMNDIATFSNAHPEKLGTDKMPVTSVMKQAWTEQAIPSTFYGKVIAVFIGDYCPIAGMKNPGSFWKQDIRACKYLKDTLARLMAFEGGEIRWRPETVNILADNAIFPWVDFQYTTKRDDFRWESAELMRQYLDAVRPLIVPSFEKGASSVLREDFGALYSEHEFNPMVGIPEIHYYSDRGKISNQGTRTMHAELPVNPDDCYIHIPSIHPGHDKYDYGVLEVRRVFDMTMWQVFLMIECALNALEEGFVGPRSQLCAKVLGSFLERWSRSGNAAVFDQAKSDMVKFYAAKPGRYTMEPLKSYKTDWDGKQVNINLSSIVSVYWKKPDGTKVIAKIAGGRSTNVHPPKGATGNEAIRTIHFLPTGVDIRDHAGNSSTYTLYRRSFADPTFPGHILRVKLKEEEQGVKDMIELWEYETGLDFDSTVPKDAVITGSACQNCAVGRDTCGSQRPCARCVRMNLECKPQTLLNKKKFEKKGAQVEDEDD